MRITLFVPAFIGIAALAVWWNGHREPVYHGRTVRQWLERLDDGMPPEKEDGDACFKENQRLGTREHVCVLG